MRGTGVLYALKQTDAETPTVVQLGVVGRWSGAYVIFPVCCDHSDVMFDIIDIV